MNITFVIPVSLLQEAATDLQPPEKMVFVTGVPLFDGKVIVLTHFVRVDCEESRGSVVPDPASVHRVYMELRAMGMDNKDRC